jgi:hypothetical protein
MVQPINYMGMIPQPDLARSLAGGLQLGSGIREMQQQRVAAEQAQAAKQQYAIDLQAAINNPTQNAWNELIVKYPNQREAFESVRKNYGDERLKNEFNEGAEISMALENGRPDLALPLVTQAIAARKNSGQPVGVYQRIFDALESEDVKTAQANVNGYLAFADPDRFKKMTDARTAVASEQREAQLFPVLQKQKEVELRKATSEAEKFEIEAKYAERLQQANLKKLTREINQQSEDRVQSSSIRPDGTVVMVTSKGNTRVIGADGVELVGDARVNAVRAAEEFGADIQGVRAGARISAEGGQKAAIKAFEVLEKTRANLGNLDNAIAALDAGATTGVIANKFPNWKASTIELQNIQNRLGLDIIGSVTFGALSEGELSLALQTALPLNMKEKQLRDWLVRKKAAQEKLANYVSEQARFLTVPGRNLADWQAFSEQKFGGQPPAGQTSAPGTGGQPATPGMPPGFRRIQ